MSASIRLGAGLVLVLMATVLIQEVPAHLGYSEYTGWVIRDAIIERTPPAPLIAPTGVQVDYRANEEFVRVSWDPVPGATEYHVFRALTPYLGEGTRLTAQPIPETQLILPRDVRQGVTYWYFVQSHAGEAKSPVSRGVRFKTK